jgi:hypothetical protein
MMQGIMPGVTSRMLDMTMTVSHDPIWTGDDNNTFALTDLNAGLVA